MSLHGKKILLVVSGGIAAYKAPDLVRGLMKKGGLVRVVATKAALQFTTPMALSALTKASVGMDQFMLDDDHGMNHIELTREVDIVLVAPLTANLMAKMATGIADDLASTLLLASNKPIIVAPAMNVVMWQHPATQSNFATLKARGVTMVGPASGELACGETGEGRMAALDDIVQAVEHYFRRQSVLAGLSVIVTSGPTHEAIDPVRYIANRSSGKQGHAIAEALAALGANVTLVSGPVSLPDPKDVKMIRVESALEMDHAVHQALPADVAIFTAAVADWRVVNKAEQKRKKGTEPLDLELAENPDILAGVAKMEQGRPRLVIGFAAETNDVLPNALSKLSSKGCDLIIANNVSAETKVFGGDVNRWSLVRKEGIEEWPEASKKELSIKLAERIAVWFAAHKS